MSPRRIVVGVSGGIAAYKACAVVRQLSEAGHQVRVIPTESALRFVGAATFEALSGHPVRTGVFDDVPEVPHVRIGSRGRSGRGGSGHRGPAGAGGCRPGRRSAHRDAVDGAMSGAVRARHAHRDVATPGDRRECRGAAAARRGGARTGVGPADRLGHRSGQAAGARRDHGTAPSCCWPVPMRCRTISPGSGSSSPQAAPGNRSIRCGSSATAARESRATQSPEWRRNAARR